MSLESINEIIKFRAGSLQQIRSFFSGRGYTEADVPLMSNAVIPEAPIELFRTRQVLPYGDFRNLFLLPSPEYYLKKLIAAGCGNIFNISHSFRNSEQSGRYHNPEFSMLEWYTMGADYIDSINTAEDFLENMLCLTDSPQRKILQPPFERISIEEIFKRYTGLGIENHCTGRIDVEEEKRQLRELAAKSGLNTGSFDSWEELFNLIFVHQVEPNMPSDRPIVLYDYPAGIPALAKPAAAEGRLQRWELYAGGIELANCYTEETDYTTIKNFFDSEINGKKDALIPVEPDYSWCELFRNDFPQCSGVALGVDRLMMLMSGSKSIRGVILFPLSDIIAGL